MLTRVSATASYPQLHSSAFAVWARRRAGLGMVTSLLPDLRLEIIMLVASLFCQHYSVWMFSCVILFVLLTVPTNMPAASSPVRSNVLPFACPEIHLGFCHVKLKDMHHLKLIWANLVFIYLQLVGFLPVAPLILLAFPLGFREFVLWCLAASWDFR